MLIYPIHSRHDDIQVHAMCRQLSELHVEVFYEELDIRTGEIFASQLSHYIRTADIVLFFYSQAAEQSAWVRREVEYALAQRKRIIPVLLEPYEEDGWARFSFARINGCYLYDNPRAWDKLLRDIVRWNAREETNASPLPGPPPPTLEGRPNRHMPAAAPAGIGIWQSIVDLVARMVTPKPKERTIKCFIAGSKALQAERDALRAVASIMYNKWSSKHFRILTYTFEDFDRAVVAGGHQTRYNRFISEEADWAIFVINEEIGGITLEEFNTAMDSFKKHGRPKILVMAKNTQETNDEIAAIKAAITEEHQYWSEYSDLDDLKHIFEETLNWDLIDMYM